MTLRVGIISGNWGMVAHLPAWRAIPGVEVVGVCTAHRETAEAAASEHGIEMPFWDAQEMARHPDVDLVDVGTRPSYRRDMCLASVQAGKHVYCGVPFMATVDEAREVRDAAIAARVVTAVDAYAEHFGPFRLAKEIIEDGTLGTIHSVVGRLEQSLFPSTADFPYNWFRDPSVGTSAPRNLGSHLLHLLVYLVGPVAEVSGTPAQFVPRWDHVDGGGGVDVAVPDTAVAALRFASGPVGMMTTSWATAAGQGFHLDIGGERGRLVIEAPMMPSAESIVKLGRAGAPATAVVLQDATVPDRLVKTEGVDIQSQWSGDPMPAMARSFWLMQQAIAGNAEAKAGPDFACACHVQSVIDGIYRSGEGGGWLRPAEGVPAATGTPRPGHDVIRG